MIKKLNHSLQAVFKIEQKLIEVDKRSKLIFTPDRITNNIQITY